MMDLIHEHKCTDYLQNENICDTIFLQTVKIGHSSYWCHVM